MALLWQAGTLSPRTLMADPYLRHVLGFQPLAGPALHPAELRYRHPGGASPGAAPFSRPPPAAEIVRPLLVLLPVIIAIFGMVAVHGRQGGCRNCCTAWAWTPATICTGLFRHLAGPLSSSTCRWLHASSC